MFISQHHVCSANDDQLTDEIVISVFTGLLCGVGALRNNRRSVYELWVTNGYDIGKFRLGINQRPYIFLITCILE